MVKMFGVHSLIVKCLGALIKDENVGGAFINAENVWGAFINAENVWGAFINGDSVNTKSAGGEI